MPGEAAGVASIEPQGDWKLPAPSYAADKPVATREAYGAALCKLGAIHPGVIALDGDVKASQWLLERRVPGEYGTKSTVDVVTHSQEPAIPATISTAQLEAELEEMDE